MGSWPSAALQVKPPDVLGEYEKMASLRSLLAQRGSALATQNLAQQQQRLQLEEQQRKLNEAQAFREAYSSSAKENPNASQSDLIDATVKKMSKNPNVSPDALQQL